MQDYFTMIMLVDLSDCKESLDRVAELLGEEGERIGVTVRIQHEDIFNAMHKL